jgi:hypothetical protein
MGKSRESLVPTNDILNTPLALTFIYVIHVLQKMDEGTFAS